MPGPKHRLPGPQELGRLIDERIRRTSSELQIRHDSGAAPVPAPAGGGTGGSSGEEPAYPESMVQSLCVGTAGQQRSGHVQLLEAEGSTLLLQDVSAGTGGAFEVRAASLLVIAELPTVGEPDLIYKRSTDNSLWWDRSASGSWTQLDVNGLDRMVKVTDEDASSGFLEQKLSAGPGIELSVESSAGEQSVEIGSAWQRNGTVISPSSAGDRQSVSCEGAISPMTLSSVNGPALLAECSGSGSAIHASANEGVGGYFQSLFSHGAVFKSYESNSYSLVATDSIDAGKFGDYFESSSIPDAPQFGKLRLFAGSDGLFYAKASDGALHDLCMRHGQTFPAASGRSSSGTASSHILMAWTAAAFPAGAAAASVSGSGNNNSFTMPVGAGFSTLGDCFARLEWTSSSTAGLVSSGAQIALGQTLRRPGSRLILRCRLRINSKDRFSHIELALCDSASSSAGSGNQLATLNAGSWAELELGPLDVSGWQNQLRLLLCAQGTTDALKVGLTQLDIEFMEVRAWAE